MKAFFALFVGYFGVLSYGQRLGRPEPPKFPSPDPTGGVVSVLDYGADPSGVNDSSGAFQLALDALDPRKSGRGGICMVPPGNYSLYSNMTIPESTYLVGSYEFGSSHDQRADNEFETAKQGSSLRVYANVGDADGPPLFTVASNGGIKGFVFSYPAQDPSKTPVAYPWTVSLTQNNPSISDCEFLGSYQTIIANGSARFFIARIYGQPAYRGVTIDRMFDIGR